MIFENKSNKFITYDPLDLLFDPAQIDVVRAVENPEHLHVVMISLNSTG